MAEYTVDARGMSCPQPMLMTKKAFKDHDCFEVLVNNETSKEIIERFCTESNASSTITQDGEDWKIIITKK